MGLFLEHGVEHVAVAQIAEVAEKTVYNHFRTKAELVFDAGDEVLDRLTFAIRSRAPGESAISAVRAALVHAASSVGDPDAPQAQAAFRAMVAASPTLQAHQLQMAARYERTLAAVLAEETAADAGSVQPFLAAAAFVAALRAGVAVPQAGASRAEAMTRALDMLGTGLKDYAIRHTEARS